MNHELNELIDGIIQAHEDEISRLKEKMNSINKKHNEEPFKIDDQTLLDAVLGPLHSITAEYVTLRCSQKHPGHNALAQLINRIKDYELTTNQRMSQLMSEIEALEQLVLSLTHDKEVPSAAPSEVPDDSRELARLKGLICAMVDHLERRHEFRDGNAPGHSHKIPGVWDIDNSELAGKKCSWCELWQEALEIYRQKDQFYN